MENREHNRFRGLKDYTKSITNLGKQLKIPGLTQATNLEQKNAIGTPVAGTGFVRILMYVIAGILLIGIILLGVDQWMTPIFQRGPGSPGFFPIPGTDSSEVFWENTLNDVRDIQIGGQTGASQLPSVNVIAGQNSYTLTLDVMIEREYVNNSVLLENDKTRYFFVIGQTNSLGSSLSQDRGSSGPSICGPGLQNLQGKCYGSCPPGNYVSGTKCIETKARNSVSPSQCGAGQRLFVENCYDNCEPGYVQDTRANLSFCQKSGGQPGEGYYQKVIKSAECAAGQETIDRGTGYRSRSCYTACSGDFPEQHTTNNQLCKKTTNRPVSDPTLCSSDQEKIGDLCYSSCNDGYNLDSSNRTQCISSSKSWTNPILEISLTNMKNQINITYYQDQSTPLTIQIDNVPIYEPFRIGLTVSPYAIEGYLNGLLQKTLTASLRKTFLAANESSKIFATSEIKKNTGPSSAETLSSGIKVLNVRAFGYIVSPAEMKARMKDLRKKSQYRNAGSLV
jgi:hypothetical protein